MVNFLLEKVRIATYSFGPMCESTNDTIFGWEVVMAAPLQILVYIDTFLYTAMDSLPSAPGITVVSKKGMAPSSLFSHCKLYGWVNTVDVL